MTILFQVNKIKSSMDMDQKDAFQRLSKLLEEQGELFEAYFDNADMVDSVEEAIDNLLVTASIAYVIDKESLAKMEHSFNSQFNTIQTNISADSELIKLAVSSGKISDSVQKYLKVGASIYKGEMSKENTLLEIEKSILILSNFIHSILETMEVDNVSYVNSIIDKKNTKWMEKALFGQGK